MREQIDELARAQKRTFDPLWADDRSRGRHDRIRGVSGLARRIGGGQRRVADKIDLGRNGDVEHGAIVFRGDLVHQRQGEICFKR